jgi:lipopolysaccharide/colanic/teichoic acid biosynthesis glycosyltransferase
LDLILGVGTALLAVIVAAFVAMVPWLPKITEFLIQCAVNRLPQHQRARFKEEWRGHVDETSGDLDKLDAAIGFLRAARRIARVRTEGARQEAQIFSLVIEATAFVALVLLPISPLLLFFFGQHYSVLSIGCIIWTYGGLLLCARRLHPVIPTTPYAPLSTTDGTAIHNQQTKVASELILREHGLSPALHRLADIEYSLALLLFMLPLFLLTAIAIRLESAGPVFDRSPRIGHGWHRFMLLKFRSTRNDDGISHSASQSGPRLTRIGRIIRELQIDELAQLFNVLRGEMSLVGPCPAPPFVAAELERDLPFFTHRVLVKPGLIGWAQINRRRCDCTSVNDARLNLSYDLYYLKHRSWLLDLLILFRTSLAAFLTWSV